MYAILTIILFVTVIIQGVYNIKLSKLQRHRIAGLYKQAHEALHKTESIEYDLLKHKKELQWFLKPIIFNEKTKNWIEQKDKILKDGFIDGLTLEEKRLLINRLYNSNHSYQAVRRQVYRLEKEDKQ